MSRLTRRVAPGWAAWAIGTRGDVDATVAQVGFNLAQALLPVAVLAPFGVSRAFAIGHLLPGYALGFLVGALGLTALATRLAKRSGGSAVTVHAYGNSVPAIIAYTLLIFLPVLLRTGDPIMAWRTTAGAVVLTGLIKLAAAPVAPVLSRVIPAAAIAALFGAAMYSYLALVLMQRLFDQPVVGLVALGIVLATQLAGLGVTRWRIPPFLVAWLVPLAIAVAIGYTRPQWEALSLSPPFAVSPGMLSGVGSAIEFLPIIAPMAVYLILQDVAANTAASIGGDSYPVAWVVGWDALATIICGLAGSIITPVLYAVHGPYKASGARINYTWWSAAAFFVVVVTGLSSFVGQLFPWPILSALIAYVAVGVGLAALRSTPSRHHGALLLAFVLPGAAVVASAVSSTVAALGESATDPKVVDALDVSVHWQSLQALANGFLLLVLVISAVLVEMVDRRFTVASVWCLIAAVLSWVGLLHGSRLGWGVGPQATLGWLIAALVMYSARWWSVDAASPGAPAAGTGTSHSAP